METAAGCTADLVAGWNRELEAVRYLPAHEPHNEGVPVQPERQGRSMLDLEWAAATATATAARMEQEWWLERGKLESEFASGMEPVPRIHGSEWESWELERIRAVRTPTATDAGYAAVG